MRTNNGCVLIYADVWPQEEKPNKFIDAHLNSDGKVALVDNWILQ